MALSFRISVSQEIASIKVGYILGLGFQKIVSNVCVTGGTGCLAKRVDRLPRGHQAVQAVERAGGQREPVAEDPRGVYPASQPHPALPQRRVS